MILCEIKDDKAFGYRLDPIENKVRKFKEEQLSDTFKVHSAIASDSIFTIDSCGVDDKFGLNTIDSNRNRFHFLRMYSYDNDQDKYRTILEGILNGDFDDKMIYTFCQSLKVSDKVRVSECRRLMLINKYIKNVHCGYPVVYKSDDVIEINEKLHFLFLLLRNKPNDFTNQSRSFSLSLEEKLEILDNFTFVEQPVFISSLDYLEDLHYSRRGALDDTRDLAYYSDSVLSLVKKMKK